MSVEAVASKLETRRPSGGGARPGVTLLWLLVAPAAVFFIAFFLFPVASMLAIALDRPVAGVVAAKGDFTLVNFIRFFSQPQYYMAILRTIEISVVTALAAAILGYPLAFVIAKTENPARNTFLMILVLASMQLDTVIRLYGLMVLMGDNGLINGALRRWGVIGAPIPLMYNMFGVIAGDVQLTLPFMVLSLIGPIRDIHPSLEEAARSLGASRWATFRAITLPLSMPGIPRRHAARLRADQQQLCRAGADGRLEGRRPADPHLRAGEQRRPLAVRRGDLGDPVLRQSGGDLHLSGGRLAHGRRSGVNGGARIPLLAKIGAGVALACCCCRSPSSCSPA